MFSMEIMLLNEYFKMFFTQEFTGSVFIIAKY